LLSNWTHEQIAEDFGLSPHTVKTHVRDIHKQLMCDGRVDFLYQAAHFLKPI
jgi:DNA-binding CsgD family transcriptional regulator